MDLCNKQVMTTLEETIQNWIVNETDGLIEGRLKNLPNISLITRLTQGKNREIWKFVTSYVRSKQSVAFTRKILQLKRAEKEREICLHEDKESCVVLKSKVDNAVDKIRFLENTLKSITKHLSSLNISVKNSNEENCTLNQKCTLFELATLNLKAKNEALIVIINNLYKLLSEVFANKKTKCFTDIIAQKSSLQANVKINKNFNHTGFNSIINEMVLFIRKKLLDQNTNFAITNLVAPVTEIMNDNLAVDLINLLKHASQMDLNSLKSNIEDLKEDKKDRLSETYLQSMKQDLVDSCFQRKKLNLTKCSLELSDLHFYKKAEKLQQEYISLHIQNECLYDSIHYLESKLASELDIVKNIKENNAKQKAKCLDIEIMMEDFYKKLNIMHLLFDQMPVAFSCVRFSLNSCRMFIDTQLLFTIKLNKDNCLTTVIHLIDCDSKLSLELLKNKDFLKDSTFAANLNCPAEVWKFLSLKPFQSRHLVIEKLVSIKKKVSIEPELLYFESGEVSTLIAKQMICSVEDNINNLEIVKKNLFETKKSCKNFEVLLKDWWYQDAQYIPSIEYQGKTLKMWLAILNVLE